jgi:hypothetical protein
LIYSSQKVAGMAKAPPYAAAPKAAPVALSPEMMKMYGALQEGVTSCISASIPGLKLASPSPTMRNTSKKHKLVIVCCNHLGQPAIFFFWITGDPDHPFYASWCEKVLREKIQNRDVELDGMGLESPLNLYVNGVPVKNNKGYDVKLFTVRLSEPASLAVACQLGQKICAVVNHATNCRPEAVCPMESSPFHPVEARWQDVMGNE